MGPSTSRSTRRYLHHTLPHETWSGAGNQDRWALLAVGALRLRNSPRAESDIGAAFTLDQRGIAAPNGATALMPVPMPYGRPRPSRCSLVGPR